MIFRQFLHTSPIGTSYLFGCGGQSQCVVVDPFEDMGPYLEVSRETGMRIVHVIDTHVHADHVSGGCALADAVGATYLVHESIDAPEGSRLRDGQDLTIGNVTIHVLHTPGHTPEHVSLLVTDRTRGPAPWFVLTGHTLLVGDMGRTELATTAEDVRGHCSRAPLDCAPYRITWKSGPAHSPAPCVAGASVARRHRR